MLWVMIPFVLIFLLGLFLLLRPQYQVPIVEVVDTFTRQEKTGQRSPHRHTVAWYRQLGLCCAVFLLCYVGTLSIFGIDMSPFYSLANDAFYNQSLLSSVFSLLLIGVILSVSYPLSVRLRGSALMDCVKQISIHLNKIFVIH